MRPGTKKSLAAVAVACIVCFGASSPAGARVRVSVQLAVGSAAVGGVALSVALSDSWETLAADGGVPDALIELGGGRMRFGVPLAPLDATIDAPPGDRPAADGLLLTLIRWRF
jgi:hypothetical protein